MLVTKRECTAYMAGITMGPAIHEVETVQTNEGGCLCRAVRYRISGTPLSSIICHCATCRIANAAPIVAWLTVDRLQFRFLSGLPQPYQSSKDVVRRFCGLCGSQITYEHGGSPNTIDVTTMTLDDTNIFPPTMETWLEHKVPWQASNQAMTQASRGALDEA